MCRSFHQCISQTAESLCVSADSGKSRERLRSMIPTLSRGLVRPHEGLFHRLRDGNAVEPAMGEESQWRKLRGQWRFPRSPRPVRQVVSTQVSHGVGMFLPREWRLEAA